ncbi:MAG: rhamnogalacturonan lyase [Prevotella sp.]|nr:rhamnogalacturonan lyase [Prevotella sp.]
MKKLSLAITTLLFATSAAAQDNAMIETLDRGVVALPAASGSGNFISWRFLATDNEDNTRFELLRDGKSIAKNLYATNYVDASGSQTASYQVVTFVNGNAVDTTETVARWSSVYRTVTLNRPATGANGGTYSPNDMSVGDVDGDGQYELIVKWDPSNAKDNSQSGITDVVYIDCYKLVDEFDDENFIVIDSRLMWRINLGINIRAGAHYTQFQVYDYDSDGRAELICKTAPNSRDGLGNFVNQVATDPEILAASNTKSWRTDAGRINGGQEYLTVFSGSTGEAIHTIFYNPNRNMSYGGDAAGTVNWGVGGKNDTGSYGNRGERYLAATAHLDGADKPASAIFSRGYYDYTFIWAVDFDGQQLHQRWLSSHKAQDSYTLTSFDENGNGTTTSYSGCRPTSGSGSGTMYQNGNHNLSIADVDGDGCDEIVWGSAALNNDGTLLYGTGFGHGDAIHLADHCPDRPGLEVFQIHEGGNYGWDIHDACTGTIIRSATGGSDNGRGMAAATDAATRGSLFWSANDRQPRSAVTGATVYTSSPSYNFRIYWDGDLQDELLDGSSITKMKNGAGSVSGLRTLNQGPSNTCNSSKNTPNLQADILGDWREEVILHNGSNQLAIYTTNIPTNYRMPTLMHEHTYRMGICWQNTSYNQPPHVGSYLPDVFLPHLVGDNTITALTGQQIEYNAVYRYASSIELQYSTTPDGDIFFGELPQGLQFDINNDNNTISITGTPQQTGNYEIGLQLNGLGGEKAEITIAINVTETTGICTVYNNENENFFDLMGRRVSTFHQGNIYIERRQGSNGVSTRKVIR